MILNMLLLSDGAVFSSLEDLIKDRDVIIYINESKGWGIISLLIIYGN